MENLHLSGIVLETNHFYVMQLVHYLCLLIKDYILAKKHFFTKLSIQAWCVLPSNLEYVARPGEFILILKLKHKTISASTVLFGREWSEGSRQRKTGIFCVGNRVWSSMKIRTHYRLTGIPFVGSIWGNRLKTGTGIISTNNRE